MLLHTSYKSGSFVDPRVRKEAKTLSKLHRVFIATLPLPFSRSILMPLRALAYVGITVRAVVKHKILVIHIHDLPLALTGIAASRLLGKKCVLDLHEPWPLHLKSRGLFRNPSFYYSFWLFVEWLCVSLVDQVITVCEEARNRIGKGIIISNYTDWQPCVFTPHSTYVVGYAGGLQSHRGVDLLIKAFAVFVANHPSSRLHIFGSGTELESLKKLAEDVPHVEFFGEVPSKDLDKYLTGCSVCVVPHIRDDFTDHTVPHKLFEYMALGKPVIVSNCVPLKRIVEEAECGVICRTFRDYADAMEMLMHPNILGLNGAKAIREKYNWDSEGQKLVKLYEELE